MQPNKLRNTAAAPQAYRRSPGSLHSPWDRLSFFLGNWLMTLCWPLGNRDAGFCRQARDDLFAYVGDTVRVKKYFDRNALDDFNEVASGVIGGQQSEVRPGTGLKAVDASRKFMMGHGVNLDVYGLTYLNPFELRFFEIGQNPDVVFDHGHQRLPNRPTAVPLNTFLCDPARIRLDYCIL